MDYKLIIIMVVGWIAMLFALFLAISYMIEDTIKFPAKKFRIIKEGNYYYPQYKGILGYTYFMKDEEDYIYFNTQICAEEYIKNYKESLKNQIIEVK